MEHKLEGCVMCCVVLRLLPVVLELEAFAGFCGCVGYVFSWCAVRFFLCCVGAVIGPAGCARWSIGIATVAQFGDVNPDCRAITCVLFRLAVFCCFSFGSVHFCVFYQCGFWGVPPIYDIVVFFYAFLLVIWIETLNMLGQSETNGVGFLIFSWTYYSILYCYYLVFSIFAIACGWGLICSNYAGFWFYVRLWCEFYIWCLMSTDKAR